MPLPGTEPATGRTAEPHSLASALGTHCVVLREASLWLPPFLVAQLLEAQVRRGMSRESSLGLWVVRVSRAVHTS